MPSRAEAIVAAHARVATHVRRTPLLETASPVEGAPAISMKLESLQFTGSFKPRGAFNNLLTRPAPAAGCAAASGGNHGAAVAFAASRLGVSARIFVPEIASPVKIAKIKSFGAEVRVEGPTYYEALALCDAYVARTGALAVNAYDSEETIAGQGALALEWEAQLAEVGAPPLDTVLVAVGGGGLIGGIAAWFEGGVKVVGVEPEGSRALHAALAAGAPVDVSVKSVAADSLGARRAGELCLEICRRFAPEVALVSDASILAAQASLWRDFCLVAEPGGAAAYAALASGAYVPRKGERVGILLCGGNADLARLAG
jgi:threonine dehydratase